MPRQNYTITTSDVVHATAYLEHQVRNFGIEFDEPQKARRSFKRTIGKEVRSDRAVALNNWCEKYLTTEDWRKLKASILKRRSRRRAGDTTKQLTVSRKAHRLLTRLAKRDNVTLSVAIETHVPKLLNRASRR